MAKKNIITRRSKLLKIEYEIFVETLGIGSIAIGVVVVCGGYFRFHCHSNNKSIFYV